LQKNWGAGGRTGTSDSTLEAQQTAQPICNVMAEEMPRLESALNPETSVGRFPLPSAAFEVMLIVCGLAAWPPDIKVVVIVEAATAGDVARFRLQSRAIIRNLDPIHDKANQ